MAGRRFSKTQLLALTLAALFLAIAGGMTVAYLRLLVKYRSLMTAIEAQDQKYREMRKWADNYNEKHDRELAGKIEAARAAAKPLIAAPTETIR